jgi:hypothetical protein
VSCGSCAVVVGERVADAAQRVTGLKGDVVGDAADGADQGQQIGPGVRCLGGGMLLLTAGLLPVEVPAGA